MPFKTPDSPYWQYSRRITVGGRSHRVRGSTGTRNRREAERIEEQRVAEFRAGLERPQAGPLTLDEAFGTYFDRVARHQPSWKVTASQAKGLLADLKPQTRLGDLTTARISEFIARRRATAKNATVNRQVQLLKRVARWCAKTLGADAPKVDWQALHLPEPPGIVRQLTGDEEARLFERLADRFGDAELCTFLLIAGCRVRAAVELEWTDLDWQARTITLRAMKRARGESEPKPHVVPLTSDLAALLGNLPRVHARVFTYLHIGPRGPELRPYTADGWNHRWRAARDAAKVVRFRRHDLRHTAVSRIVRKHGVAMGQRLAGHRDIASTMRYAHLELEDLRAAMEKSGQTVAKTADPDAEDIEKTG